MPWAFREHTAHVVRLYLYKKIQDLSFGNFDRFPTSKPAGDDWSATWNAIKEAVLQGGDLPGAGSGNGAGGRSSWSTAAPPAWSGFLWIALALMLIALGVFINKMKPPV